MNNGTERVDPWNLDDGMWGDLEVAAAVGAPSFLMVASLVFAVWVAWKAMTEDDDELSL